MSRSDELTRFTMSLPTQDYETLGELAALLGVSRAALLRDLLEAARPVWVVVLDAVRTAAALPDAQRAAMTDLADRMGAQLKQVQTMYDEMAATIAAAADDDGPPPSNTGVRNP